MPCLLVIKGHAKKERGLAIFHSGKERKTSKIVSKNLSKEGGLFRGFCLCIKGRKEGLSTEGREERV